MRVQRAVAEQHVHGLCHIETGSRHREPDYDPVRPVIGRMNLRNATHDVLGDKRVRHDLGRNLYALLERQRVRDPFKLITRCANAIGDVDPGHASSPDVGE
jgi:hypothetical protein